MRNPRGQKGHASDGNGGGGGGGGGKPYRGGSGAPVEEALKIALQKKLKAFKDSDEPELAFPPNMDNIERRWVHQFCKQLGLESKSQGKGEDRFLKVKRLKALKRTVPDLGLSQQTLAAAKPLLSVKGAVKGSATGRRGGAGSAAAAAAAVAAAAKVSDDEIEGEMVMLNFRKP
eukprot:gene28034-4097_t